MVWGDFNYLAARLCNHCSVSSDKVTSITKNLCFYIYCTVQLGFKHHLRNLRVDDNTYATLIMLHKSACNLQIKFYKHLYFLVLIKERLSNILV